MNMPPTRAQIAEFGHKYNLSIVEARTRLLQDYFHKEIEDIRRPIVCVSDLEIKMHKLTSIVQYLVTQL